MILGTRSASLTVLSLLFSMESEPSTGSSWLRREGSPLNKKIRVMIVDDSALVRQTLQDILSSDPHIEVMATAQDPLVAAQKLREEVAGRDPPRC